MKRPVPVESAGFPKSVCSDLRIGRTLIEASVLDVASG